MLADLHVDPQGLSWTCSNKIILQLTHKLTTTCRGLEPIHYTYNSADGNARQTYYSVQWVPWMTIDGVTDGGSTTTWQNHILTNAATTAPLALSLAGNFDYQSGNESLLVTLDPETGVNGTYTLHVVLVQDGLYYMGSNGYPDHENVMRDMFPSSSGTTITLAEGLQSVEQVDFSVPLLLTMMKYLKSLWVQIQANCISSILMAVTLDFSQFQWMDPFAVHQPWQI